MSSGYTVSQKLAQVQQIATSTRSPQSCTMKTGVRVASVAAPSKTATETEPPQQGDGRIPTTRGEVEAPKVKKGRRRKKNKKQRPRMPPRVTASSTCVRSPLLLLTHQHTPTHTCTQRHVEDDVGRITYSHDGGFRRVVPYNYVYVVRSWWHHLAAHLAVPPHASL